MNGGRASIALSKTRIARGWKDKILKRISVSLEFSSFARTKGANLTLFMSTLAEIEAAADALPIEQKKKLLEFLASRVNGKSPAKHPTDLAEFAGALHLREDPLAWQKRVRGEWE
jgi:hypothetical protein